MWRGKVLVNSSIRGFGASDFVGLGDNVEVFWYLEALDGGTEQLREHVHVKYDSKSGHDGEPLSGECEFYCVNVCHWVKATVLCDFKVYAVETFKDCCLSCLCFQGPLFYRKRY